MQWIRKKISLNLFPGNQKRTRFASLLLGWIIFAFPTSIEAASFPVVPEFQVYHSIGSRGSTYLSGAAGLAVHLFDEDSGPGRYLHFLSIMVPSHTMYWQNRLGAVSLVSQGKGFEFGVHDQWSNPAGKGATLSLRHLEWEETQRGSKLLGKASVDQLHMGWSWSAERPGFVVWLLGLDVASLHLPIDRGTELQLALGMRTAF